MEKVLFGKTSDGQEVYKYIVKNASGAQMEVLDLGARLYSMIVPDQNGTMTDVILGYDDVVSYEENTNYFGETVGRCGNRTANAQFVIGGVTYQLEVNDNDNNLHSGSSCYGKRLWNIAETGEDYITFSLVSPDGDGGFPGEFHISVTYTLTEDNQLQIHYDGVCDQDTVANLTNHSYFNLSGHDKGSVMNHLVQIHADYYTPVIDSASIPTGEIAPVAGTPMDFTTAKEIGRDIGDDFDQLIYTQGYDHNYVLNNQNCGMRLIAKAKSPVTGIAMEVYTDLPGVQFYVGNYIKGPIGKGGAVYEKRHGFCLETQYYPNCANVSHFPGPILKKGEKYNTTTIYKFI